jgi:hypothetical protein
MLYCQFPRPPARQAHAALIVFALIAAGWWPSSLAAASGDIVLYATDVTTFKGAWTRTLSTTGAGGQLMKSIDSGWSINTALASPQNYFEASFEAPANVAYHLWLRLRATGNSRKSDSVMVQLSDGLTIAGSPVWRTGSTSALIVNLEPCDSCGVSGWGWADSAWWSGQNPVLKFAATGKHTIRVQTREDGVQIDQIVLSPATYLNAAPGATKNDTTIVAKSTALATTALATTAATEVVLYAGEASRRAGNWSLYSDTSAALGKRNGSRDYGWAMASAPSTTPADVLEWTFNAVAGIRYRTWLRLRAANNSVGNDSVWVQFSDAVDSARVAKYRLGTASGLAVVLEDCSGCGVSNWGWQRRAWWTSDTGDVYFLTSGTKTLRVQTREDGASIDQVVLSPSKFVNSSPGSVRNDAIMVNRNGTTTLIGTTTSSTSYPQTLTFMPSVDHATAVLSYILEVFPAGTSPSTAKAAGTLNLGKPNVVSGAITANIGATLQALPSGSYFATVKAVNAAGTSRSAPSNTFSR